MTRLDSSITFDGTFTSRAEEVANRLAALAEGFHGCDPNGAGEALTTHPQVDSVTFNREPAAGRAVAAAAASHPGPVVGRCLAEKAAPGETEPASVGECRPDGARDGMFKIGISRDDARPLPAEPPPERLVAAAESLVLGDPADPATDVGPLSSRQHHAKVTSYLDDVPLVGGKVLTGGRSDGWFVAPTVPVGLAADARACREEIFDPILPVLPFEDEDEAVRLANDSPFGLNAMCFTTNRSRGSSRRATSRVRLRSIEIFTTCSVLIN